jgi:uncharacterized protein (TIGR02145 family)
MKTIISLIMLCGFCLDVMAQAPQKMSYQAVVRDATGNLVTNHVVSMRITILQGSLPGTNVYQETQTLTTNANGLLTIEIGGGTGFDVIDWGSDVHFIKTETDPTGGTDYSFSGTSQLLSVPYALYAETVRDGVSKTQVDILQSQINKLQNTLFAGGFVIDMNGNRYNTVKIGTQIWMAENLKTSKYNDGTDIPLVPDSASWANLTTPGCCWYKNDQGTYGSTYGAFYNWYAVNTGKLCPVGWHLPTDAEWTTLENYMIANGYNFDGTTSGNSIAKSLATATGWTSSTNQGAVGNTDYPAYRNKSGFSGLPGGGRYFDGAFDYIGYYGYWWSSTELSTYYAWCRYLDYDYALLGRSNSYKEYGFSVRCLRDF